MANTTTYMGLKHYGFLPGFAADYQLLPRKVAASNATAIFWGDPVKMSSGYIQATGTTTAQIDGVFQGCYYVNSSNQTVWDPHCPASTTATCYIIASPGSLFIAQSNGTALTQANVNNNAGLISAFAGQTVGGYLSGYQLDAGNIATTSTYPIRIVRLFSTDQPNTSVNGADDSSSYNMAIVTFNNTDFKSGQTGV